MAGIVSIQLSVVSHGTVYTLRTNKRFLAVARLVDSAGLLSGFDLVLGLWMCGGCGNIFSLIGSLALVPPSYFSVLLSCLLRVCLLCSICSNNPVV